MVAEVGGDLATEAWTNDVYGGRVDREGRRGQQLDQFEGILADETARDKFKFQDQISKSYRLRPLYLGSSAFKTI